MSRTPTLNCHQLLPNGSHNAWTGDEWVADKMVVRVGMQNFWLWHLMDSDSRHILATHLSRRLAPETFALKTAAVVG